VRLKEVIQGVRGKATKMRIPLYLGKDVKGNPLVYDLTDMPHLLIAGRTGTGKSVCLNSMILSILMTRRPDEVKMLMIDPKMVELSQYRRVPHLMHPVVTDMKKAEAILAWASSVVPRFVVTSSFGAESAVLLHLVAQVAPQVPVLFLDTGLHFEPTLTFRRELAVELGLSVIDVKPQRSVRQQAEDHGDELWRRDPDRCCGLRKTRPLRQMLRSFDGWATGVRRVQTPERAATPVVEPRRHDERWLVKVAPLAGWTDDHVDAYLRRHQLPRHTMVADGYPSIGCAPCTARVAPGDDPRAGRWAAFDDKTECGIHLDDEGRVRRTSTPG
jgi:phosphoadenosine phosphosulfate reductase